MVVVVVVMVIVGWLVLLVPEVRHHRRDVAAVGVAITIGLPTIIRMISPHDVGVVMVVMVLVILSFDESRPDRVLCVCDL